MLRTNPDVEAGVLGRAGRVLLFGLCLAVMLYVGSLIPGVRARPGSSWFWDVGVEPAILLGSAAVCLLRAYSVRQDRTAWICIGTGLACYAAGTLWWYGFLEDLPQIPYPSVADGLWLALYPLCIAGIGLLLGARLAGSATSTYLDGIVAGLGLTSTSAAFILPRITQAATGSRAAVVTNVTYPLLDLALVATIVGAMAALGTWRDRSWILFGAGFCIFATFDTFYLLKIAQNTYQVGTLIDAGYPVAALLMAAGAANRTSVCPSVAGEEGRSFLVPASFGLLAMTVLVVGDCTGISSSGALLAVGSLLAVGARTALAVREIVRLSDSRRQAYTDALTGLPNRRAFYEVLEAAEAEIVCAEDGSSGPAFRPACVLLIDLDRFKEVNDALGHQIGDRVLRDVSRRFSRLIPTGGTIARLGGDEIAILVPDHSAADAVTLAQQLLVSLAAPFTIEETSIHIDASIGVTVVEPGSEPGKALAQADLAMYRAKHSHSGWEVYHHERDGNSWDHLSTVEDLRVALDGTGLSVEFQPVVAAGTNCPKGSEALIRWSHPQRGNVPPDVFLPLAERAGLMPAITRTVLSLALDEATSLRQLGLDLPVSVNLSASDLLDTNLAEYLDQALQFRGLPGKALRIEITESLLVAGSESLIFLHRLRELDIELAVDDYGTGYSCMAYLHDLPISFVKIDRSFTARILSDERTAIIVSSTIDMAHRLGLQVVAEGVETAEQRDWLTAHSCDLLQGYLIARSLPAQRWRLWLQEHSPAQTDAPVAMPHSR